MNLNSYKRFQGLVIHHTRLLSQRLCPFGPMIENLQMTRIIQNCSIRARTIIRAPCNGRIPYPYPYQRICGHALQCNVVAYHPKSHMSKLTQEGPLFLGWISIFSMSRIANRDGLNNIDRATTAHNNLSLVFPYSSLLHSYNIQRLPRPSLQISWLKTRRRNSVV